MPAEREDEICRKALELLSDLCSKGEVQDDHCLDFIYYFRDLARPRYTDSAAVAGPLVTIANHLTLKAEACTVFDCLLEALSSTIGGQAGYDGENGPFEHVETDDDKSSLKATLCNFSPVAPPSGI
ncbi:Synaptotagmin-9 [Liparis tanakae]|uniref:Synaptotagmin-9 n=1 Tax=Liparis tanakae TaxID=230148 RepID=A0A4Z2I7R1_9TELE|nr:Synaptotagmin-9 [Liparis tanakae]